MTDDVMKRFSFDRNKTFISWLRKLLILTVSIFAVVHLPTEDLPLKMQIQVDEIDDPPSTKTSLVDLSRGASIRGTSASSPATSSQSAVTLSLKEEVCLLPDGTKLAEVRDKTGKKRFDMVVVEGDFMSEWIAKKGFWEIRDVQDVADLAPGQDHSLPDVTAGGAFYDVGGNIGYYSLLFAAAGYPVVAFEPLPTNLASFKASLCLNPELAARITLIETGLSDHEAVCRLVGRVNPRTKKYLNGIATLKCPDESSGVPLQPCDPDKDLICQDVVVSTLDRVVLEHKTPLPRAAIVKMDIEGHELQALQGGVKFFEQHKPALVQFENKNPKQMAVSDWLTDRDYEVGVKRGHDGNTVARYTTSITTATSIGGGNGVAAVAD